MNSITCDSQSLSEVNIETDQQHHKPATQQADRFARRMNKYRIHQSDCRMRNDQSFLEFCEQESDHIKKLQDQKPNGAKQRRIYKRNSKKKDINIAKIQQQLENSEKQFEMTQQQLQINTNRHQLQSDIQSDLCDLNYKEMLALMNEQTRMFNDASPSMPSLEQPQCTCTPSDFLNAYNPSSSYNNFY